MDQSLNLHRLTRSSLNPWVQLGSVMALLITGSTVLPVQAEPLETGVNVVAANAPVAQPQLFVNSSTGKDDVSAGRSETTPFKTIAYALQQAKAGDIVQLAAGLYSRETGETFPLVVPQGVTLQGNEFNQGSTVTIIGGDFFASSWWGSQNITLLPKSNSQVIGVSVTNGNSRGTGIWIESSNATIRGCTLTKSAREGVFVAGTSSPTLENNLFADNNANGVALTGQSTGVVRNNTFQNTGFGIAVSEKAAPQLMNNQVRGNVDGIVVSHSATPQLRGNVVENNKRDGLVAISVAKPDLGSATAPGRNVFRNNGRFALYNATLKNTLIAEGNEITGNMQLTANGPTGVDQNASPEAPVVAPHAEIAMTNVAPAPSTAPPTNPVAKSAPGVKVAVDTDMLKQELAKAPTVQYKGKTYVLLDNLIRLTK